METIIDASFDALFVINDSGIIQKVNEASVRVFGWTVDELVGKNINIIMPEERARMHDSYLESEFSTLLLCCSLAHRSYSTGE
jgi:PAS domain S-box-containing protein